ncbi:hypothetical protein HELRODRAFT_186259 [Helobdella robusta]|uniref:Mitochondrial thiamine pyrophosphate carrier n=1 Tax=Helobdella robusta TaxID=6412 RepID=T1FNV8_HELRO|nr:hypothetical protein HELRODRAFT_186259 [Helobdella robusta]ESO11324.1 hypothetical protein HELRODRAFT_186259 [Helobdella robusta]
MTIHSAEDFTKIPKDQISPNPKELVLVPSPNIPWYVFSMAGACSGVVTRALTQPLDVVKIRLQIQDNPMHQMDSAKYRGMFRTGSVVCKSEGVRALWKGHVPAQVLSISYGVLQFSIFELLTKYTNPLISSIGFLKPFNNFVCGGVAGSIATFISYPFDVVRTRYIIQDHPKTYTSMHQAFKVIVAMESWKGLYKGFVPTIIQIAPNTGLQFAFYKLSISVWDFLCRRNKYMQATDDIHDVGLLESLICGSVAGLTAKTIVYPLDLAKKRLQIVGFHDYGRVIVGRAVAYSGMVDCIATVARQEGVGALYKGLVPSMMKALLTSALIFASYEKFYNFFVLTVVPR